MESTAEGDGLPPQPRDGVRATIATGSNPRSFIDESGAAKSPVAEAGSVQGFGARPVIVPMAGLESDPALIASHERIAPVSTNSVHRTHRRRSSRRPHHGRDGLQGDHLGDPRRRVIDREFKAAEPGGRTSIGETLGGPDSDPSTQTGWRRPIRTTTPHHLASPLPYLSTVPTDCR